MLHQLVESKKNSQENKRKSEFFLTTLAVLVSILAGSWTYSLYAKDYAMGGGELDMASLVAPVSLEQTEPPRPEPQIKPEKTQAVKSNQVVLKELYEDLGRGTPPKETTGEKDVVSARTFDLKNVKQGLENVIPSDYAGRDNNQNSGEGISKNAVQNKTNDDDGEDLKVVKETPKEEKKAPAPPKSLGVVNGFASNLVKPAYPLPAKQIRAEGAVNVQVLIDERGNVVSATAVSGHPLLRGAAVGAAKQSKFTPTLLSGQPVKVTGVIVYNFKAQ